MRCCWLLLLLGCSQKVVDLPGDSGTAVTTPPPTAVSFEPEVLDRIRSMTMPAVPADPTNRFAEDAAAAHLGQWLFYDARLSGTGRVACATCHVPSTGLAEDVALHDGLSRHTPSAWDTVFNRWFFWDGRADSHWAQAAGPLEHPDEHGGSRLEYAHLVDEDPELRAAYETVFGALPDMRDRDRFPDEGRPALPGDLHTLYWETMAPEDQDTVTATFVSLLKAIAAYERKLVTGETRVDHFVRGLASGDADDLGALTESEQRGLALFAGDANCHFCHAGGLTTNREFHNVGLATTELDNGRFQGITTLRSSDFNGAGRWSDDPAFGAARIDILAQTAEQLGQFKVPSLRGISRTAPYMRDGSRATLADVIDFYDRAEEVPLVGHREELIVPLDLTDQQKADLEAFLLALDPIDEPSPALLAPPASPIPD
ncbi:MAG: cytochrome c peroxidase [Myxococcota bacterium]|jgi:cytochrome c peroxidase